MDFVYVCLQVVSELRANLEFDSSTAGSKQKKKR